MKSRNHTFGPFYPAPLQQAVNHAERFAVLLTMARRQMQGAAWLEPTGSEVWLMGRVEELEAFVLDVCEDASRGIVSAAEAAVALNRYLDSMHLGMAERVPGTLAPSCCASDDRTTAQGFHHSSLPSSGRAPERVPEDTPSPRR